MNKRQITSNQTKSAAQRGSKGALGLAGEVAAQGGVQRRSPEACREWWMRTEEEREEPSSLKPPSEVSPEMQGSPDPASRRGTSHPPASQPGPAEQSWQGGRKHHQLPRTQHPLSVLCTPPSPLAAGWELINNLLHYRFRSPWDIDVFWGVSVPCRQRGMGLV